jgi:arylsulfatase A-like enzyme
LRKLQPDLLTLPQHLIAQGYETVYLGKVFHRGDEDEETSWSRAPVRWMKGLDQPVGFALPENRAIQQADFQRMLAKYGEAARRALRHDILHFFARVFAGTVGQIRDSSRSVDPRATGTMIGSWPQQLARRIVTITA